MALTGLRVIEIAGLAPGPFCGMVLSDFGAKVIRIDRTNDPFSLDCVARGKKSVQLNIKRKEGQQVMERLCKTADVLLEPFRPGVMERLNLGPDRLLSVNPRLIYARLTGYGQKGPLAGKAGHDINYIATSGILSMLGRKHENPYPPINLIADFAGGGLTCAFGIVAALFERTKSGKGQVIDAGMTHGSAYVGSWLFRSKIKLEAIWQGKERGTNLLDCGAHYYETYKTADGKYMAVGALESQFYAELLKGERSDQSPRIVDGSPLTGKASVPVMWLLRIISFAKGDQNLAKLICKGLGLTEDEVSQGDDPDTSKGKFAKRFLTKTQKEWCEIFDGLDACVMPILEANEAAESPYNKAMFTRNEKGEMEVVPAPVLSRTPAGIAGKEPCVGEQTRETLLEIGYTQSDIDSLVACGAVECGAKSKL